MSAWNPTPLKRPVYPGNMVASIEFGYYGKDKVYSFNLTDVEKVRDSIAQVSYSGGQVDYEKANLVRSLLREFFLWARDIPPQAPELLFIENGNEYVPADKLLSFLKKKRIAHKYLLYTDTVWFDKKFILPEVKRKKKVKARTSSQSSSRARDSLSNTVARDVTSSTEVAGRQDVDSLVAEMEVVETPLFQTMDTATRDRILNRERRQASMPQEEDTFPF